MDKIRFAQFVIDDIIANDMQRAYDIFRPDYYVDQRRELANNSRPYAYDPEHKDSWSLWVDGWIIKDVRLQRGPERIKIKLNSDERAKLIQLDKQWMARAKARANAAKAAKAKRADEGQWWP